MFFSCCFPTLILSLALYNGVQLSAHQLTLSAALDCPCSKFKLESRATIPFKKYNDSLSENRIVKKEKNEERRREMRARQRWRTASSCKRDRLDCLNAPWQRQNCATSRTHFYLVYSIYLPPREQSMYRDKTNKQFVFTLRKKYCTCWCECKCRDGPIR